MVPYMMLTLLYPLVLLGVAGASVRAIWRAVTLPRRAVTAASCERCRYPVAGLRTWRCPECGSDLLRVGIVTRAMEARRRGSMLGALAGLTFLALGALVIGETAVAVGLGGWSSYTPSPQVTTTVLTPASGAYSITVIEATDSAFAAAIVMTLTTPDGASSRLRTKDSPAWAVSDAGGDVVAHGTAFDAHAVEALYASAGIAAAPTADIDDAYMIARTLLDAPGTPVGGMNLTALRPGTTTTSGGSGPAPGTLGLEPEALMMLGVLAVAALVWVLGCIGIVRRRRRILRDVDGPDAEPAATPATPGA